MKGKAKEDFERWFKNLYPHWATIDLFYIKDFRFQSGVLLEWFDSVGIYIEVEVNLKPISYTSRVLNDRGYYYHYTLETRQEALTEAFNKAEEIYNGR